MKGLLEQSTVPIAMFKGHTSSLVLYIFAQVHCVSSRLFRKMCVYCTYIFDKNDH